MLVQCIGIVILTDGIFVIEIQFQIYDQQSLIKRFDGVACHRYRNCLLLCIVLEADGNTIGYVTCIKG